LRDLHLVIRGDPRNRRLQAADALSFAGLDTRNLSLGKLIENSKGLLSSARHCLRWGGRIILTDDLNLGHRYSLLLLIYRMGQRFSSQEYNRHCDRAKMNHTQRIAEHDFLPDCIGE